MTEATTLSMYRLGSSQNLWRLKPLYCFASMMNSRSHAGARRLAPAGADKGDKGKALGQARVLVLDQLDVAHWAVALADLGQGHLCMRKERSHEVVNEDSWAGLGLLLQVRAFHSSHSLLNKNSGSLRESASCLNRFLSLT